MEGSSRQLNYAFFSKVTLYREYTNPNKCFFHTFLLIKPLSSVEKLFIIGELN
jgi:hypothetical protein